VLSLERDKRVAPTTPVANDAVIASRITYVTRIAELLNTLIALIADRHFKNLIFGGPSCAPARPNCSLYFLYGDDPDQVLFVSAGFDSIRMRPDCQVYPLAE